MTNEKKLNRPPTYEELTHHGIKGQKHGLRRWQNPDGSLTPAGYVHYGVNPRTGDIGYFRTQKNEDHHDSYGVASIDYDRIDRIFSDTTWDNTWNRPDSRLINDGKKSVGELLNSKEGRKELEKMAKKMSRKEKKAIKKESEKLEKEIDKQEKARSRQTAAELKEQRRIAKAQKLDQLKETGTRVSTISSSYSNLTTRTATIMNTGRDSIDSLGDKITSSRYNTKALKELNTKFKGAPPKTLEEAYARLNAENQYLAAVQTRSKYDKSNKRLKVGTQAAATGVIVGVGAYSMYKIFEGMKNA